MSNSLDINYWMQYSQYIFNRFNGLINNVYLAKSIVLGVPRPVFNGIVFGSLIVDEVNINLIDISSFVERHDIPEDKIRTMIVFTILHELSHCDQDIDFVATKHDRRETLRYELENDCNTLQFMSSIMDQLPQICYGNLNQYMLEMMIHKYPPVPFREPLVYRKISSPYDKIIKILSSIADTNVWQIVVNERLQNVKIVYRKFNMILGEIEVMKDGRWQWIEDTTILKDIVRSESVITKLIKEDKSLIIDVTDLDMRMMQPMIII